MIHIHLSDKQLPQNATAQKAVASIVLIGSAIQWLLSALVITAILTAVVFLTYKTGFIAKLLNWL